MPAKLVGSVDPIGVSVSFFVVVRGIGGPIAGTFRLNSLSPSAFGADDISSGLRHTGPVSGLKQEI